MGEVVAQFIKFGLVGVSNSMIYYAVEMFSYYILLKDVELFTISVKIVIVTAVAFIISIINSYFWNSRYVFHKQSNKANFLRMTGCYAFTGLILSPIIKILLKKIDIAYWLVSLFTLILMLPLNFLINKLWAFGK